MTVRRKKYRKILIAALCINVIAIGFMCYRTLDERIPNQLIIFKGEESQLNLKVPAQGSLSEEVSAFSRTQKNKEEGAIHFNFSNPVFLTASDSGSYRIKMKLFGLLPIKNIEVKVLEKTMLIPGGETIGIYAKTKGVMVLGTGEVTSLDGTRKEPALNIVKSGDYIMAVNDNPVSSIKEMNRLVEAYGEESVILQILRDDKLEEVRVKPVCTGEKEYKLGIWIREDTQGVGTLTYQTQDGVFGALGHGITDGDTGKLVNIREGSIYRTEIVSMIKGNAGEPGEMVGIIHNNQSNKLGSLLLNTSKGIFGTVNGDNVSWSNQESVPIGLKQDIKIGKATIRCKIEDEIEEYSIWIDKIKWNPQSESKGMVIRITDERLLEKTGGIIQGMSGSPILQDGKLIGAVTHVFVQNPEKGYGTFIENMLEEQKQDKTIAASN